MFDEPESHPKVVNVVSTLGLTRGFTLIKSLTILSGFLLLIGLLLPSNNCSGWPRARRMACDNNLRQIAIALNNYRQTYDAFPPAYTVDADGRPLHSWRTLILPYLDEGPLYKSIDLAKPWDDPANAKALATSLGVYRCPESGGMTTYLAIVGPNDCLDPTRPRRSAEITDGARSTLMVIEAGDEDAVPWMAPVDADEALVMSPVSAAKPPHAGGRNACFADGSVRFLEDSTPAKVLRAMMTISGGEKLPEVW